MKTQDENKLPKWAQDRLAKIRRALEKETQKNRILLEAHSILINRSWFTFPGPKDGAQDEYGLFMCSDQGTRRLMTLFKGDMLLVGRADK